MFCLLLNLTLLPPVESQARETHQIAIHSFMPGTTTYVMGVALAHQIIKHSTCLKATNVAAKGFLVSGKMLVVDPKTTKDTLHCWSTYTFYDFANGLLTGALTGVKHDGARAVALGVGVTGKMALRA